MISSEVDEHVSYLELRTVFLVFMAFQDEIISHFLKLVTDNSLFMSYLDNQEGSFLCLSVDSPGIIMGRTPGIGFSVRFSWETL